MSTEPLNFSHRLEVTELRQMDEVNRQNENQDKILMRNTQD
jgi:hypothetical protein